MTQEQIISVFERLRSWSEERQEDAARVILEMEAQDASPYHLTDEQLAEVRRRRTNSNPKYVPIAEARNRFRRLGL
jgi:Ser-tRNA(Ala) deacylase AlaX